MEDEEPQELNLSPPEELELHEKMYLMMKPLQSAIFASVLGSIACLVLVIFVIDSMERLRLFYEAGGVVPEAADIFLIIIEDMAIQSWLIVIVTLATIAWYALKMRPVQKKLDALRREFTKKNYFLTLGLTSHTEDVVLDILDAMFEIFPELKEMQIKSFEKTGYNLDMHPHEIADRKGGIYTFDATEKTKHGYFVMKYFSKDSVNFEELEECTKITKANFTKRTEPYVMRLVCMADMFDEDVLSKYEKLLKDKKNPPVDLILVTEKGYTPLKISERVVDR